MQAFDYSVAVVQMERVVVISTCFADVQRYLSNSREPSHPRLSLGFGE